MFSNSLKVIQIYQNTSELRQIARKNIILTSPHLFISLYEMFINADMINVKITKNKLVLTVFTY